jgi:hypothetical protein
VWPGGSRALKSGLRSLQATFTKTLGRLAGREVPVLGWVWLAAEASQIRWRSINRYNRLARREDQPW